MAMAAVGLVLDSRYRLEGLAATGGFGEVWLATDQVLARPVVVKLLDEDLVADAEMLARFRSEARLASLITHPNLARIFDYNDPVAGQPPFLVMEFVRGQSLADRLTAGPLAVPETLDVLAQVAAGMDAAHEAGLINLDVGPANVLLSEDGAVKITDFGIGRTADTALDLYPLGALARECLPARVPEAVATLIAELTDEDSVSRPGSAAEVAMRAAALREQLAPRGVPPPPPAPAPPPSPPPAPVSATTTPWERISSQRQFSKRLLLAPAAVVLVVAAVLFVTDRLDTGIGPAQNDIQAGNQTVQVDGAAFKGQPVSVADSRLRRLGFSVRNQWRPSATVAAGLVIAVSPTGRQPVGSLVTVLGSGPARGPARILRPLAGRHHKSGPAPAHSPTGKGTASPKASSSPTPQPTSSPTPGPTGTPSPSPSQPPSGSPTQTPTSSPQPSGSPVGSGDPSPPGSASPSPDPDFRH
jgi:serine/threonine protein kinase